MMLIRRFRNQHAVLLAIVVIGTICIVLFMSPKPIRQETEYPLDEWVRTPTIDCHGHFRAYGHEFAWLQYSHILSNTTFSVPCDSKVPSYNFQRFFSPEGKGTCTPTIGNFSSREIFKLGKKRVAKSMNWEKFKSQN
ncbi:hypothetical protein DPMN_043282 [Dreissena polymorpha]|uniref:Uncharacterized protein n=1 Tax=Dreissena polymorpha TaxID=45954 RepID=A0A9D4D1Z5_DREPO|nr:hypothetical protein DPMN_043282 [Dreissena polymorpha]